MTDETTPAEITPEQIKSLLEKAKETEWKYLLRIEEWARQGTGWHTDYAEFKVLYGEADMVKLGSWDSGYPYEIGTEYLIIPKTVPVVIGWEHVSDDTSTMIIYIFTKDGWKQVDVY
jgi:hypothetical protein